MTSDLEAPFEVPPSYFQDAYELHNWGEDGAPVDHAHEPDKPLDAASWRSVDLTEALKGEPPPEPDLLRRSDGRALMYGGRVHWIQGEPESAKSMVCQHAAAEVLNDGGAVLYIDLEDDAHGVVERLLAMGVAAEVISERFDYRRPDEPLYDRHGQLTPAGIAFATHMAEASYVLAIVDGVTESLAHHSVELNDNTGIARWMNQLPKMVADQTGAAVIAIDHVTKSNDDRKHYAIGGQHKLAGLDGAAFGARIVKPFGRAVGHEPVEGMVELTLAKDRRGWLRGHYGKGDVVAVVDITAYPDGGLTISVNPPPEAGAAPRDDVKLQAEILRYLCTYNGASKTAIEVGVTGNATAIRGQLLALVARGFLEVEHKGQAHLHHITDEGREWLDE